MMEFMMKIRQYFLASILALAGAGAAHADEVPSGLFEANPLADAPVWIYGYVEPTPPIDIGVLIGPDGIIDPSNVTAVPEPQTYALLGAGLMLIGAIRRRQRRNR